MIEDYLSATRSNYTALDPENCRFSKIYPFIENILKNHALEFCLIRSSSCKTEIVEFDDKKHVIIDTQTAHYMNALDLAETLSEPKTEEFNDLYLNAFMFIACTEIFYNNKPTLAKHMYEQYSSKMFASPIGASNAMGKLYYATSHEIGHNILDKNPTILDNVLTEVDDIYDDLVSSHLRQSCLVEDVARNFYYQTRFEEIYRKNNRMECAADAVSAIKVLGTMKKDDLFRGSLGSYGGYFYSSLVCLHEIIIISEIQSLVRSALVGKEYETTPDNELYQRLRITRYLYSRLLVDELGKDEAKKWWDKFTDHFSSLSSNHITNVLKQVYKIIASNKDTFTEINNDPDYEFCANEFFMQT